MLAAGSIGLVIPRVEKIVECFHRAHHHVVVAQRLLLHLQVLVDVALEGIAAHLALLRMGRGPTLKLCHSVSLVITLKRVGPAAKKIANYPFR